MDRRPIMTIVLVLLGAVLVGLLGIGAFPPTVTPVPVERVVPNDRFLPR